MRLFELHEEMAHATESAQRFAMAEQPGKARIVRGRIATYEERIQNRLGETGSGWNEPLRFGVPDAERIYRPLWWLHLGHEEPVAGCRLCEEVR